MIVKQPGHFTSMKKERGAGTRVCHVCTVVISLKVENRGGGGVRII